MLMSSMLTRSPSSVPVLQPFSRKPCDSTDPKGKRAGPMQSVVS